MKRNIHPNYLTARHSILTLLKGGGNIGWDDNTEMFSYPDLNLVIVTMYRHGQVVRNMHYPLSDQGVTDALKKLAEWRRMRDAQR